jgi:hypothetical protein
VFGIFGFSAVWVLASSLTNKKSHQLLIVQQSMALGSQALGSMQYLLQCRAYKPYIEMAYVVFWYLFGLEKETFRNGDSNTTFSRKYLL